MDEPFLLLIPLSLLRARPGVLETDMVVLGHLVGDGHLLTREHLPEILGAPIGAVEILLYDDLEEAHRRAALLPVTDGARIEASAPLPLAGGVAALLRVYPRRPFGEPLIRDQRTRGGVVPALGSWEVDEAEAAALFPPPALTLADTAPWAEGGS